MLAAMDRDAMDTLLQLIGVGVVIVPMAVLVVWLALASRRRQAAEAAEPPPEA